jgi:ABC-type transport system substrate-binding protein
VSRQEAVAAFLAGRISRRTLIRQLVAGGVSVGAAASYAAALDPETASATVAAAPDDLYPLVTLKFDTPGLAWAVNNARLKLNGTCGEEVGLNFAAYLRIGTGLAPIGFRNMPVFLTGPGTRTFIINIDPTKLQGRRSASIHVHAVGSDSEGAGTVATAITTLR